MFTMISCAATWASAAVAATPAIAGIALGAAVTVVTTAIVAPVVLTLSALSIVVGGLVTIAATLIIGPALAVMAVAEAAAPTAMVTMPQVAAIALVLFVAAYVLYEVFRRGES